MVQQTLRTSKEGNKKAKKSFLRKHLTEIQLAVQIGLNSREAVENFFQGEPIERYLFQEICLRLDLKWEEIAQPDPFDRENYSSEMNAIAEETRKIVSHKIQELCGNMNFLTRSEPISLDDIYTRVHILESNPAKRSLDLTKIQENITPENFERLGMGYIAEPRVLGIKAVERYPKVMVLGKPGAGKTTFLKYLAIQCNAGNFNRKLLPIFVTLKDFYHRQKNQNLIEYITEVYAANHSGHSQFMMNLQKLMNCGRVMILLDGLDEVTDTSQERILKQIQEITESFHQNQFVISCRMAVQKDPFEKFIKIQVADLEYQQIITLASKWFHANNQMVENFLNHLKENVNIQEFATNPLLLNLLCLVFEKTDNFPTNYLELYQQGLEILLQEWDETKSIENDMFYRNISFMNKQKLIDNIAFKLFQKGEFFVKKEKLVQYIFENLKNWSQQPLFFVQKESEWILNSIETQHKVLVERAPGLYSFYHSNLQHYLTARAIVNSGASPDLLILVNSLTKPAWREVFLLASEMMPNSDELLILMKKQIDRLMASDEKLQQFLNWTHQKALSVPVGFKPAAVRAFYLALFPHLNPTRSDLEIDLGLTLACDPAFDLAVERFLHLDYLLVLALARSLAPTLTRDLALTLAYVQARVRVLSFDFFIDPEFEEALATLRKELTQSDEVIKNKMEDWQMNPQAWTERLKRARNWWQANRLTWTEELKKVMSKYRNLGHDWEFNYHQQQLLKEYYYGNQLLIDCLNCSSHVSNEVREEIESTLLLPIAELEPSSLEVNL